MKPVPADKIFNITDQADFYKTALDVFIYQAENNRVYREFINYLGIDPPSVSHVYDIPFLPIGFFKNHKVVTGTITGDLVFESSGTTGRMTSRHYITDVKIYERSFLLNFRHFYGDPSEYFIAALLPSYTGRANSSLIYMVNSLIEKSGSSLSGFYGDNREEMLTNIEKAKAENLRIILFGVSFALLDLAEKFSPDLSGVIVIETGGMKGRRKEMTREELHSVLKKGFNLESIHSEYGMTELLSQAWSKEEGIYFCPPWMRVMIREPQDPLSVSEEPGRSGGINIIDLANINSCSFIATDDLGKLSGNGSFGIIGRFDSSDIRGCNLLIE